MALNDLVTGENPYYDIKVEVYYDTAPHTLVDIINARMDPAVLSEIGEHGAGGFRVSKNDPKILNNPALLDYRNYVRVRLNGVIIGGFIIQTKKSIIIGAGEEADEVWEIAGEGPRSWSRDASVYPPGGLRASSAETRYFNFSTERGSWYVEADWQWAKTRWYQQHILSPKWPYPANWPDVPLATWIAQTPYAIDTPDPVGFSYYRHEFTTPGAGTTPKSYAFFVAVDDSAEVFVDGEQKAVLEAPGYYDVTRVELELLPGPHVIGVKTHNLRGVGEMLAALFTYGDPNVPTSAEIVNHTGMADTWRVNAYPESEPGWTPGDVLLTLLNEAKDRGVRFANNFTPTFTVEADSAGNAWDMEVSWAFDVGVTYEEVIATVEELGCDIWVDPNTLEIHAWKKRGYDRSQEGLTKSWVLQATNLARNPGFEKGTNVAALEVRRNLFNNPAAASTTGFTTTSGQATITKVDAGVRYTLTSSLASNIGLVRTLTEGTPYRVRLRARANKSLTAVTRVANTLGSSVTITTSWQWFDFTAVAGADTSSRTGFVLLNGAGHVSGDWIEIESVLIAAGDDEGGWFSGDESSDDDFTPSWLGTPNNSQSILSRTVVPTPLFGGSAPATGVTAVQSTRWSSSGGKSLRLTKPTQTIGYYQPMTSGLTVLEPGKTYTAMVVARLLAPQTGTLHSLARSLVYIDSRGTSSVVSDTAPNSVQSHELSITFTVPPTGVTWAALRLYHGATSGDILFDKFALFEGEYGGVYFDGSTSDTAYMRTKWTGEANASTSTMELEETSGNSIIFSIGHNLTTADETGQAQIANTLMLRTPGGWSEKVPGTPTSISKYGRVETQMSTNLSESGSSGLVKELFRQKALPEVSATFEIIPVPNMIPFLDFNVGDWVTAPGSAPGSKESRRIMSIAFTEDSETGRPIFAVEFDTLFKDRQTELERRIARMSGSSSIGGGFANSSDIPSTVIVTPPGDPVGAIPDPPTGLVVTTTGRYQEDGGSSADFDLLWDPVITGVGFGTVIISEYEVWGRRTNSSESMRLSTVADTMAHLTGFRTKEEWAFKVRAISPTGGPGGFSEEVTLESAIPIEPLKKPSAPTLTTSLGTVTVNWDGLLGGDPAPGYMRYVRVDRKREGESTWTSIGSLVRLSLTDNPDATGEDVSYRLVAVDGYDRPSPASDPTTITVLGVFEKDIDDLIIDKIDDALNKADEAWDTASVAVVSTVPEYALSVSEDNPPLSGWSTTPPTRTPGSFIWQRIIVSYGNGTSNTTAPVLVTGNTGSQGSQGIQGPPGDSGDTAYTWLKYADSPTTGMSDSPTGKTYIGLAFNKPTATESSDYEDYSWSLFRGPAGEPGIQGPPGPGGESTYTWVKYATSNTGADMSDDPDGKSYIGLAYNKTTATESTDPADYMWASIQGSAGVGLTSIKVYYQLTSSSDSAPAQPTTSTPPAGWTETEPAFQADTALWSTTRVGFTDGSFTYSPVTRVSSYTGALEALIAANGKNKVVRSTSLASMPANYVAGDLWWQYSGSQVIAMWIHDGTEWVSQTITDSVITNLNAATITTGYLNGDRIDVNTITASMMAIGDFTNLASGSDFETDTIQPWRITSNQFTISTTYAHTGTKSLAAWGTRPGTAVLRANPIPVQPGDKFYVEFWMLQSPGWDGLAGNSKLRVGFNGGGLWGLSFAASDGPNTTWIKRSGMFTVPAGTTSISITLVATDATAGNCWIDDIIIRRMYGGELIVDGDITARKLNASEIWASNAWLEVLRAGVIETSMLTAEVGQSLNLSSNNSVNIIVTRQAEQEADITALGEGVANAQNSADDATSQANTALGNAETAQNTADEAKNAADDVSNQMAIHQTYYNFGPDGAIIGKSDSALKLVLMNDSIEIRENDTAVSAWDANRMWVKSFVGETVVLANHQLEQYGSGTVVRAI